MWWSSRRLLYKKSRCPNRSRSRAVTLVRNKKCNLRSGVLKWGTLSKEAIQPVLMHLMFERAMISIWWRMICIWSSHLRTRTLLSVWTRARSVLFHRSRHPTYRLRSSSRCHFNCSQQSFSNKYKKRKSRTMKWLNRHKICLIKSRQQYARSTKNQ